MDKKYKNSMQEILSKFSLWFFDNYEKEPRKIFDANALFFGSRTDLPDIALSNDTEGSFNEWLILDFSINNYDKTLPSERINLLSIFLDQNAGRLSKQAEVFAHSISKSYVSFYKVKETSVDEYIDFEDLFSGNKIRVFDTKLSTSSRKDDIIYARFCKNEKGQFVCVSFKAYLVPELFFEGLKDLIKNVCAAVNKDGHPITMEEFLKWNSYIYFRELFAMLKGDFSMWFRE